MFLWPHFYLPCCFLYFQEHLFPGCVFWWLSVFLRCLSWVRAAWIASPVTLHFFLLLLLRQRDCSNEIPFSVHLWWNAHSTFVICSLKTFFREVGKETVGHALPRVISHHICSSVLKQISFSNHSLTNQAAGDPLPVGGSHGPEHAGFHVTSQLSCFG